MFLQTSKFEIWDIFVHFLKSADHRIVIQNFEKAQIFTALPQAILQHIQISS